MASNKRPPLELDDLTNNLKQSSGRGVDAFFSPQRPPQEEEKKPVIQEESGTNRPPYYSYSRGFEYRLQEVVQCHITAAFPANRSNII
jgi:hypothetical protein